MENTFLGTDKIGEIVSKFPGASYLFKDNHIDFCCGGDRTLTAALMELKLEEDEFLAKLNVTYAASKIIQTLKVNWLEAASTDLIEYVVSTHHGYLQKELPVLSELINKIVRVHGPNHGEMLLKLNQLFQLMKKELEQHLIAEEQLAFPLIKEYDLIPSAILLNKINETLAELETEHSTVGDLLKEMRAVTNDYELPEDACRTYTLTFHKLEEMEADLFQHIHLENNILFPRYA
ncbi:MAG: iron-sulfur cluster repair di-iron protein [Paenibacillus sp. RIFOXYA1_FULL_44_5]|nr:MAG: iron-sulfur cluster repair di-iron protein [Paenibacillus sp. RIFOXYA1_FULL_44_5]